MSSQLAEQLAQIAQVVHGEGDFASKLVSRVQHESGSVVAKIEGSKRASERNYTTVQISEDQDIDLNSDLVYCNHSCDPNVVFDVNKFEVRVADGKSIKPGDDMTFFYPSTEWDMEQPFDCTCGTKRCLGTVRGARYIDDSVLDTYWLNAHIESLVRKRKDSDSSGSGSPMSATKSD